MGNCLFCTTTNSNNDDEHAHQEQDEEEESVLQPRIVLLTPEGQKVRSILGMKSEDILQCVINDSNELMNNVAATGEFLSEIRSMSADDVFVRDAQHWQEDEQRAHQEQEDEEENEEEPLLQPRIVLLTPEGLNVRSILAKKPEDLRPCVINTINALMNAIAATGDFLSIVRASLVDDLLLKTEEQYRREQQQQTRGMTITIVHKDWHKIETKYETAVRLFPDILQETWNGMYLIKCMSMRWTEDMNYNLRLVSLIPLIVRLGIQLQQFNALERGGLLKLYPSGRTPLQCIIGYDRNEHTTDATDECYSAVVERLREENLLVKEDIQQYNLLTRGLCGGSGGCFQKKQLQYLVDWDPMALSIPCDPDHGTWLFIHWGTYYGTLEIFSAAVEVGLHYFPEKFGFLFCESTQTVAVVDDETVSGTPFQLACKKFGREEVIKVVTDQIDKHYPRTIYLPPPVATTTAVPTDDDDDDPAATTSTRTTGIITTPRTTITESSLLLLTVTDTTIHFDGLYMLLRKDPNDALLQLQQNLVKRGGRREEEQNSSNGVNNDNGDGIQNENHTTGDTSSNIPTSKKRKHE
mmetsp:Transcript_55332/g.62641  ORF Transcript_55332/g.62641 Transcript_55332/m.62641 type:complete len:580 (+) Transcript_55332:667-2406(+)